MKRHPVVWILVHDLGLTGVPIALGRLLRWHGHHPAAEIHVLAIHDGPLRSSMSADVASIAALEPAQGRSLAGTSFVAIAELGQAGLAARARDHWYRHRARHLPRPDVVLIQGAGAWPLFETLAPLAHDAKVVVHLHELELALGQSLPEPARRSGLAGRADLILAVSQPVADLAVSMGARPNQVVIVPGSVDDPVDGWPATNPDLRSLEVISIGSASWRKAPDRALAVAHELNRHLPAAHCHWIGDPPDHAWAWALGATVPLHWHGVAHDPWKVVPDPGVLLIPSREDPLPLVALEAGARGIPVVATATGGLTDLLAHGRGWLVSGFDPEHMSRACAEALQDRTQAANRAGELQHHVRERHRNAVVGPIWLDALTSGR